MWKLVLALLAAAQPASAVMVAPRARTASPLLLDWHPQALTASGVPAGALTATLERASPALDLRLPASLPVFSAALAASPVFHAVPSASPAPARAADAPAPGPGAAIVDDLAATVERVERHPDQDAAAGAALFNEDFQARIPQDSDGREPRGNGDFVRPNELHPERARGILAHAPPGAYLSVGTERGFIGAALAPAVTHLLLFDRSPEVAAYNRMNVALLRLARDREEYVRLRTRTGAKQIALLAHARELGAGDQALLRDAKAWRRWQRWQEGSFLNVRQKPNPTRGAFAGSNYLYDEALFARVKGMADAGRIAVTRVNMMEADGAARVYEGMKDAGVPVSVVDLSNAWWSGYTKREALRSFLTAAGGAAAPGAIVVATDRGVWGDWTYHGFSLGNAVSRWPDFKRRLDKWSSGKLSEPGSYDALDGPSTPGAK